LRRTLTKGYFFPEVALFSFELLMAKTTLYNEPTLAKGYPNLNEPSPEIRTAFLSDLQAQKKGAHYICLSSCESFTPPCQ
jgi:hypothetical protein